VNLDGRADDALRKGAMSTTDENGHFITQQRFRTVFDIIFQRR
jgi:hypothetical protein